MTCVQYILLKHSLNAIDSNFLFNVLNPCSSKQSFSNLASRWAPIKCYSHRIDKVFVGICSQLGSADESGCIKLRKILTISINETFCIEKQSKFATNIINTCFQNGCRSLEELIHNKASKAKSVPTTHKPKFEKKDVIVKTRHLINEKHTCSDWLSLKCESCLTI